MLSLMSKLLSNMYELFFQVKNYDGFRRVILYTLLIISLVVLIMIFFILVYLIVFFSHYLIIKFDIESLSVLFVREKVIDATIIGTFLITVISTIFLVREYNDRKKAAKNKVHIILEKKNSINEMKCNYTTANSYQKILDDIISAKDYNGNDLYLYKNEKYVLSSEEGQSDERKLGKGSDYQFLEDLIIKEDKLEKDGKFLDSLYRITKGDKSCFFVFAKNEKGRKEVVFNVNFKFNAEIDNIRYYYFSIKENLFCISVSSEGAKIYTIDVIHLNVIHKEGTSKLQSLELNCNIFFHTRGRIIGGEKDFLDEGEKENFHFKFYDIDDEKISVPIFANIREVYSVMTYAEVKFTDRYSKKNILKIRDTMYHPKDRTEYIMGVAENGI